MADDHLVPLGDAMIADEYQRLWLLQHAATNVVGDALRWAHRDAPRAVAHIIECVLR